MVRMFFFAIMLLASHTVSAQQNVLANPGFDADLSGWALTGATLPVWNEADANDSEFSGSALIANNSAEADSDMVVLSQCVSAIQQGYRWGTRFFIPSAQSRTGSVVLRFGYFANTINCSGGFSGLGGYQVIGPFDQWVSLTPPIINTYAGYVGSMLISIAIRKTEAGGEFTALVDDTFLIREILMKNGFEF